MRSAPFAVVSLAAGEVPTGFNGRGCVRCDRRSMSYVLVPSIECFENPWGFPPPSAVVEALLRRAAPANVGVAGVGEGAWPMRHSVLVVLVTLAWPVASYSGRQGRFRGGAERRRPSPAGADVIRGALVYGCWVLNLAWTWFLWTTGL